MSAPSSVRGLALIALAAVSWGTTGTATTFLSQYLTQKAVGQFDLGPAAAFSLIYFLIILLVCFILYNWMQRVGTGDKTEVAHG